MGHSPSKAIPLSDSSTEQPSTQTDTPEVTQEPRKKQAVPRRSLRIQVQGDQEPVLHKAQKRARDKDT